MGVLRPASTPSIRQWLADSLECRDTPPRGADFAPLDGWIVVVPFTDGPPNEDGLREVIALLAPGPLQSLAVVAVGREGTGVWNAVTTRMGELSRVDLIDVPGPGMLRLQRNTSTARPSRRSSRTVGVLGDQYAGRVRESSVTLVGAGGNGWLMAQQFAALGVEMLRIIDHDHLQPENLDRMPLVGPRAVGLAKVEALGAMLADYRGDLALTLVPSSVKSDAAKAVLAEPSSLLVTCVDDDTARLAVSLAARQMLVPHLDVATSITRSAGGAVSIAADCRLLFPGQGCVACVGGVEDLNESLYELRAPVDALRRRVGLRWDQQRAGSLISINSIAVGTGVQMWLDLVAGGVRSSWWNRLAWEPGTGLRVDGAAVAADPTCRVCHRKVEWRR